MARQNESVMKAIGVLRLVAQSANPVRFTELQSSSGLAKSTLHSLLASLEASEMVRRGVTGYEIGLGAFDVGMKARVAASARDCARDALDSLLAEWGEVCHFGILSNGDVLYLDRRDSSQELRYVSAVGARKPAYATALGKAMLALCADSEIESLYPQALLALTPSTIADRKDLLAELARIRTLGYATEYEESTPGVGCIGVGTRCADALYGLSVTIPAQRLGRVQLPSMYPSLRRASEQFARTLGASAYLRSLNAPTETTLGAMSPRHFHKINPV